MKRRTLKICMAVGAATLVAATTHPAPGVQAASSSIAVTLSVASSTTLGATQCASGDADRTSLGTVLPNTTRIAGEACSVTFGSTNDTSSLRLFQHDGRGAAMWRPTLGAYDAGFAGDGSTLLHMNAEDDFYAVAVQPDGKVLAAGSNMEYTTANWVIARFGVDGAPDPLFGGGDGWIEVANTGWDGVTGLDVLPGGDIVATGLLNESNLDVGRFAPDGTPRTSFGPGGICTKTPAGVNWINALDVQADGRIVLTGTTGWSSGMNDTGDMFVGRLREDCTWDTSFNGTGMRTVPTSGLRDWGDDIDVLPDGDIVVSGVSYSTTTSADMALVRLNADGSLDAGFGTGGIRITTLGLNDTNDGASSNDTDVATTPSIDGTRLVTGIHDALAPYGWRVASHDAASGTPTSGWGTGGLATVADGTGASVIPRPDGTFLAAGSIATEAAVALLRANGTLDTALDGDGIRTVGWGGTGYEWITEMVADGDGGAYLVGASDSPSHDAGVIHLVGTPISDYGAGSDWTSGSASSAFGMCLETVTSASAVGPLAGAGNCTSSNGAGWRPVQPSANPSSVLATTATGENAAVASMRFGVRPAAAQPPGAYFAPVAFEVIAPAA